MARLDRLMTAKVIAQLAASLAANSRMRCSKRSRN